MVKFAQILREIPNLAKEKYSGGITKWWIYPFFGGPGIVASIAQKATAEIQNYQKTLHLGNYMMGWENLSGCQGLGKDF